jgi:hypothetical protein
MDWRNSFIIFVSIINIILALVNLVLFFTSKSNHNLNGFLAGIMGAAQLLNLINLYSLYTYTRDLSESKCSCIPKTQPFYDITYYYIRLILGIFIVCVALLIVFLVLRPLFRK